MEHPARTTAVLEQLDDSLSKQKQSLQPMRPQGSKITENVFSLETWNIFCVRFCVITCPQQNTRATNRQWHFVALEGISIPIVDAGRPAALIPKLSGYQVLRVMLFF